MTKAPPPKPDATVTPAPEPVVTPESRAEFIKAMGFAPQPDDVPAPKPGDAPPAPAATATPAPAATPAPPDPNAPALPPRGEGGKFLKRPAIDPAQLEEAVAEGIRKAGAPTTPAPPVPEEATVDERASKLTLTRGEKKQFEALRWLQTNKPDEFKGRKLDEEFVKFKEAEAAYIANWEKKHKGEEWDPTDASHADFYEREPKIDDDLLEEAHEQVITERATRAAMETPEMKQLRAEQVDLKRQQKLRDIEPEVQNAAVQAMIEFVEKSDPELAKLLKVGDKSVLNAETMERMKVANPKVYAYLSREAYVLKHVVAEIEKLGTLGSDLYPPNEDLALMDGDGEPVMVNGAPFHPHREIVDFALAMEEKFANGTPDKRKWEGKDFIRVPDLIAKRAAIFQSRMSVENKQKALTELSQKFWHITTPMLKGMYVSQKAKGVKKQLDWARELGGGGNAPQPAPNGNGNGTAPPPPQTVVPTMRPTPPSTVSSGELTPTRIPESGKTEEFAKQVENIWFGKK